MSNNQACGISSWMPPPAFIDLLGVDLLRMGPSFFSKAAATARSDGVRPPAAFSIAASCPAKA
jgi:hypothetical protein